MALSIRQKLWLPTLMLGLIVLVVGTGAVLRTQALVAESNQLNEAQQTKLGLAHQWASMTRTNAARAAASLRSSDASLEAVLKTEMAATSSQISELQKQIETLATSGTEQAALATVAERRKSYIGMRDAMVKLKAESPAEAAVQFDTKVMPALASYLDSQAVYVKLEGEAVGALHAATASQRMRTVWGVIGVMLFVLGLLIAGTIALVRQICVPMAGVVRSAGRISAGDLTETIQADRRDEIGDVLQALNGMQDSLRKSVSMVRQSADSIQVASSEVASGNQDLSSRTEQTAGSLQQTASSMEHLTGTVRQTAESARTANQLASAATQAAQRGGNVVTQVVQNMEEISASSRKIAEIIGVIDGISFQTNILALNAAVEAARAGEQGRGFAVVAGEVRNLAQRSANAAKEIKSLIGASVERVESGSKLVQDAGSTMSEIVSGVQRVSDIIGEITAAATEQSSELGQVNVAVTQLDQMTQQNAALVEQSAAAAESLKDQALRLIDAVRVFQLDSHDTSARQSQRATVAKAAPRVSYATQASRPPVAAARPVTRRPAAPRSAAAAPQLAMAAAAIGSEAEWGIVLSDV